MDNLRKVKEYIVAQGETAEDLAVCVDTLIKDGFQPWGGMSIIHFQTSFYQPMVRYD